MMMKNYMVCWFSIIYIILSATTSCIDQIDHQDQHMKIPTNINYMVASASSFSGTISTSSGTISSSSSISSSGLGFSSYGGTSSSESTTTNNSTLLSSSWVLESSDGEKKCHKHHHIHTNLEKSLNRSLGYPSKHGNKHLFDLSKYTNNVREIPLQTHVTETSVALLQLHDNKKNPVHLRPYHYVGNHETYQKLVTHHQERHRVAAETTSAVEKNSNQGESFRKGNSASTRSRSAQSQIGSFLALGISSLTAFLGKMSGYLEVQKLGRDMIQKMNQAFGSKTHQQQRADTYGHFRYSHYVVPLSDRRDHTSQHLGTLEVGRQRQRVNLIFDSGSTNLWIGSDLCKNQVCNANKDTLYAHDKSGKEAKIIDSEELRIEFGSGTLEGPLAEDTVYLAGHEIKAMPFALIRAEKGSVFSTLKYGGILGLAFEDMASPRLKGLMTQAMENNVFTGQNILAFYFTKNPHIRSGVHFGGVNPSLFHGTPQCLEVQKEHYWQTGLRRMGFRYGMHSEHVEWIKDRREGRAPTSIFWDTGTTWNAGPTYLTDQILALMRKHGFDQPLCDKINVYTGKEMVPWLVLEMCIDIACNDVYITEQPPAQWFVGAGGDYCRPGFMSIDVPEPYGPAVFITGEIFMRTYYTIFERGGEGTTSRVCIAKNKDHPQLEKDGAYDEALELSDDKVNDMVFLTRHRDAEPFGANADENG